MLPMLALEWSTISAIVAAVNPRAAEHVGRGVENALLCRIGLRPAPGCRRHGNKLMHIPQNMERNSRNAPHDDSQCLLKRFVSDVHIACICGDATA